MKEILLDSILDCAKLLPFLFLSYLVVEYAEHRMSGRTKELIYRAGKAGPVIGSLIGIIPQCGFSAAAAGLFAGGMVSPGTLLAVFLSTSDEMLPIMVSEGIAAGIIGKILFVKVLVGMAAGLALDFAVERWFGPRKRMAEHTDFCEHAHCGCENHSIFYSAAHHTLQVALFLFLISLVLGFGMEWFQSTNGFWSVVHIPGIEEAASALVGMIPNCAASVLITELYLQDVIGAGALFSGLLCGAGTGLLVLYRTNRDKRVNLALTAVLYASGTLAGILAGACGIL